jgi:hypothetical protein
MTGSHDEIVEVRYRPAFDPVVSSVCGECHQPTAFDHIPQRPICRDCSGYIATGPDGRCDGCAYEASGNWTSLSFGEWMEVQRQAAWKVGKK